MWGVAQRRKINDMLRDTLSVHWGSHHHDGEEGRESLQSIGHDTDMVIGRGCGACYAQKLSFGFAVQEPGDEASRPQQGTGMGWGWPS
jgi:hypothetical protein